MFAKKYSCLLETQTNQSSAVLTYHMFTYVQDFFTSLQFFLIKVPFICVGVTVSI